MKQKYYADGSVHAEFNYKGKLYSVDFKNAEEFNKFLATLQEEKMKVRTYDYGYTKIQGAETRFIKRIVFLIKNIFQKN